MSNKTVTTICFFMAGVISSTIGYKFGRKAGFESGITKTLTYVNDSIMSPAAKARNNGNVISIEIHTDTDTVYYVASVNTIKQ